MMQDFRERIAHIVISVVLFLLCWKVISWISDALWWTALRMVSILLTLMLVVFAGLFAWFFGRYLARKIADLITAEESKKK